MPKPIHVLGFSGSLRKGSYNTALLRAAQGLLPEGVTLEIFDIAHIPLYNQDAEQTGLSEAVLHFKERIAAADALLIATPEYNYSIPGVLKNAIDSASRNPNAFDEKPVAFMGASMGMLGSARSQYHLRQVCVYLNMHPINKPEVLVAAAHEKFDAEGNLTDEIARKLITGLLKSLADWTRRLGGE